MTTFTLEELLGTKLRALYQRKKARDLFDIWTALRHKEINTDQVRDCFLRCMKEGGHFASRAQIEENLAAKRVDPRFASDIEPLLSPGTDWDFEVAMDVVLNDIVAKIPGDPWRAPSE